MNPHRWLVIGSAGQLGTDMMDILTLAGEDVAGLDLPNIDITAATSVAKVLAAADPTVIVNAAAYTAVDAAEGDEAIALAVNGKGPAVLAAACVDRPQTRLIHISTDYVFAGDSAGPYAEDDQPDPRSAYGRTKLAGEQAVRSVLPDRGTVVRTAWLYGVHGQNFVKTMLRLEAERETVAVVDDQRGQPTWSRDLARQILRLVRADAPAGIYHGTSSGQTTWWSFTREIFRLIGADPERVAPTTTDQFPRPAARPANSVLGHRGWTRIGVEPIRPWDAALAEALPLIREEMGQ